MQLGLNISLLLVVFVYLDTVRFFLSVFFVDCVDNNNNNNNSLMIIIIIIYYTTNRAIK